MSVERFAVGEQVVWLQSPRGGYDYIFRVPAVVVGHSRARVRIRVQKSDGEEVERWVQEEHLRRCAPSNGE